MAETNRIYDDYSPAARILTPLLDALHWKGHPSKLAQSIGGKEFDMTIDELIDTMAVLNYKHEIFGRQSLKNIDHRLLPVLVVNNEHYTLVLKMDDKNALIFDSDHNEFTNKSIENISGNILSFKYIGELGDSLLHEQSHWINKLFARFKQSFFTLIALTLGITFLDLLIPIFIILIYDQIGSSATSEGLIILLMGVLLYFIATSLLGYIRLNITNYISIRMGNVISQQTYRKLLYLPPSYTETASISAQINRIKDFENLKRFTNSGIFLNLLELVFSFIYILAIFIIGGWIGFIPIITLILVLVLGFVMRPLNRMNVEKTAQNRSVQQRSLLELLKNTQEIKTSGMKEHWINRSSDSNAISIYAKYEQSRFVSKSNNLIYFITNASVLAVVYGGVLQVFERKMSMGALIGVILLYWKVLSSIRGASSLLVQINGLQKSFAQINRFMKLPQDTSLKANMVLTKELKGGISFNDVSIRYNKTSKAALINLRFSVEPGQILGISGHDGAGKTTILKLIMGMYLPQGGRILLDNWNIKQLEPLTLRQSIGYLAEKDMIFTGTIRSNFKYLNPRIEDDEIMNLAVRTGLNEYLNSYNYNLDSVLTEQTIDQISPSFKKVFSITRLIARDVNLYLIDEPENHLSTNEVHLFIDLIKDLSFHQKTIVVTSKDDRILNACHQLMRLNQGRGKVEIKEKANEK